MMNLKFIVDECLGCAVVDWLIKKDIDAISVLDELPGADDNSVLDKAFNEDRILITIDKDFGEMVYQKNLQHVGIILLRLQVRSIESKIKVLENLFANYSDELYGNFIVVSDANIKIKKQSH